MTIRMKLHLTLTGEARNLAPIQVEKRTTRRLHTYHFSYLQCRKGFSNVLDLLHEDVKSGGGTVVGRRASRLLP